ncbi:MAG: hypothetical protein ACM3S1_08520 [Hyphomicrobiales bacterium]
MANTAANPPLRTTNTLRRAVGAWTTMFIVALLSLFVFPPLILIVIFFGGPVLTGLAFSAPNGSRNVFAGNGTAAAIGGAMAGSVWIATHPGDNAWQAVAVSTVVSFVIVSVIATLVVYLFSLRLPEADEQGGSGR